MTGYGFNETLGKPAAFLLAGSGGEALWEQIRIEAGAGRSWRGEITGRRSDGSIAALQQSVEAIPGSECLVVTLNDLTARRQAEWAIAHTARYDSLTGLPGRGLFYDRLGKALAWAALQDRRVALLLLDLDQFKDINNAMGHASGDALVQAVVKRMQRERAAPGAIGRLGGDEFCILIEDAPDENELARMAGGILSMFQEPFSLSGDTVSITASLGIGVYPDDGANVQDLLRAAEVAMYQAKQAGGNGFRFYDARTDRETADRVRMVRELRAAFDTGSLHVAFQPQVELASGRVIGAEALVRWTHATMGAINAGHLVQIAEESGLIHALGDWVLNEVCRQLAVWHKQGLLLVPVCVNFSAMQLTEGRTVDHLLEPLRRHGVEPTLLTIEITESALLHACDQVRQVLHDLQAAGVALALDDFGTGYSSLKYLRDLPVTWIKMDSSFVQGVGVNQSDEKIIAAILGLAQALGIKVVAEGVETAEQGEFLRERACYAAQGYHFGRPMGPEEFEALIRKSMAAGA